MQPVRAPSFNATCGDGRTLLPEDLRGQVLRLIAFPEGEPSLASTDVETKFTTIRLPGTGDTDSGCVAQPNTLDAFAVLPGTMANRLAGIQMLVDANGWLRARWTPDEPRGWPTPERLSSRIRVLAEHPLPSASKSAHHH